MDTIRFRKDAAKEVLHRWWRSLHGDPDKGIPPRRGERAELCRADSIEKACYCEAYHRLLKALDEADCPVEQALADGFERLAVIAKVLAHVRQTSVDTKDFLPRLMAGGKEAPRPPVNKVRFRHLLDVDRPDELLTDLTRVVKQVARKDPVDIFDLADVIWSWNDANRMTRRHWARAYYTNLPPEKNASAK